MKVQIELVGVHKNFPECSDNSCSYLSECANHSSAGDYRLEDGMTPNLRQDSSGWDCDQAPTRKLGAILVAGSMIRDEL